MPNPNIPIPERVARALELSGQGSWSSAEQQEARRLLRWLVEHDVMLSEIDRLFQQRRAFFDAAEGG